MIFVVLVFSLYSYGANARGRQAWAAVDRDAARDRAVRHRRRRPVPLGRHRLRLVHPRRPVAGRPRRSGCAASASARSRCARSSSSATRTSGPGPPWPRSGRGSRGSSTTSSRTRSRSSSSRRAAGARCSPPIPTASRTAFDSIERTGEQALGEMRRLLGMLRDDDEEQLAGPAAVARARRGARRGDARVGAAGRARRRGRPERHPARHRRLRLPDRAGGPDERAQARRAGGRPGRGALRARRGRDHGRRRRPRRPRPAPGTGNGLLGIKERVAVVGGEIDAGPQPDGGFAVHARLPYRDDA